MELRLERTFDLELILSVVGHPEIKPQIWEEEPIIHLDERIYWLAAYKDGLVGIIAFYPINSVAYNPHSAILTRGIGLGTEMMKAGVKWMFENTGCLKVVAPPASYNKAMIRVYEKCGFRREGFSPKSFMFRNVLYDRIYMGLEK